MAAGQMLQLPVLEPAKCIPAARPGQAGATAGPASNRQSDNRQQQQLSHDPPHRKNWYRLAILLWLSNHSPRAVMCKCNAEKKTDSGQEKAV
jgi:hypothetical protein